MKTGSLYAKILSISLFAALATTVDAVTATFQYYRFVVQEVRGGEGNQTQMQEFHLSFENTDIDYSLNGAIASSPDANSPGPEGPDKAIDGDLNTKFFSFVKPSLVIQFAQPVSIDSYTYVTGNDADFRDPVKWRLDGSADGVTWFALDSRHLLGEDLPTTERFTRLSNFSISSSGSEPAKVLALKEFRASPQIVLNGQNSTLTWDVVDADSVSISPQPGNVGPTGTESISLMDEETAVYTLIAQTAPDQEASKSITLRSVAGGPSTYRYVRFWISKIRGGGGADDKRTQLSEFHFLNEGIPIVPVAVTNPGGNTPVGEGPENVIDGSPFTKWLDLEARPLVFDFGTAQTFDSYGYTTANDFPGRDPVRWLLSGSDDGNTWTPIDNFTDFDYDPPVQRLAVTDTIPLPGASLVPLPEATDFVIVNSQIDSVSGQLTLTFTSSWEHVYRVTYSSDLDDFSSVLKDNIPGTVFETQTTVSANFFPDSLGFFRVERIGQ